MVVFYRPDGGARVWYSWTAGGAPLGNTIDRHALAQRLDAADWLPILDRHLERSTRGRIEIDASPLRPILAHLQTGLRAPDEERVKLRGMVEMAADLTGQTRPAEHPARSMGQRRSRSPLPEGAAVNAAGRSAGREPLQPTPRPAPPH
ncbi:hypothetical protein [Streptomyces mutabilis]|uniref:hypothetical protein n=1 Tax=Streptomyces mutabilis TaxID=67332 RepID=UPI0034DEC675